MIKGPLPPFVKVTVCAGVLVVPTDWGGKVRVVGKRVTSGPGPPVPLNGIVCGLFGALSVMVTDPYRLPLAVGVKVTLIIQVAPGARVVPQELVCAKSPLAATLVKVKGEPPIFVKKRDCGALLEPTDWGEKYRLLGERVTAGAGTPVPVKSTT
jgi:hypothetical protein